MHVAQMLFSTQEFLLGLAILAVPVLTVGGVISALLLLRRADAADVHRIRMRYFKISVLSYLVALLTIAGLASAAPGLAPEAILMSAAAAGSAVLLVGELTGPARGTQPPAKDDSLMSASPWAIAAAVTWLALLGSLVWLDRIDTPFAVAMVCLVVVQMAHITRLPRRPALVPAHPSAEITFREGSADRVMRLEACTSGIATGIVWADTDPGGYWPLVLVGLAVIAAVIPVRAPQPVPEADVTGATTR